MIICDTTAVNTGRVHGIVKLIQDDVFSKGFQKPQYIIGCQHHVLDLLLKHVMNFVIQEPTSKPELNYSFIDKLTENYVSLQADYHLVATDDVVKPYISDRAVLIGGHLGGHLVAIARHRPGKNSASPVNIPKILKLCLTQNLKLK